MWLPNQHSYKSSLTLLFLLTFSLSNLGWLMVLYNLLIELLPVAVDNDLNLALFVFFSLLACGPPHFDLSFHMSLNHLLQLLQGLKPAFVEAQLFLLHRSVENP